MTEPRLDPTPTRLRRLGFHLCRNCQHPRAAHTTPDDWCRACPDSQPCEGWEPEETA